MAAAGGSGGARPQPMRKYKQKKENKQPELSVMAAAGGGGGARPRPMRKYKQNKKKGKQSTGGGCGGGRRW